MTRGINQVDEEAASIFTLLDERQVSLFELVVQRDGPERQTGNMRRLERRSPAGTTSSLKIHVKQRMDR